MTEKKLYNLQSAHNQNTTSEHKETRITAALRFSEVTLEARCQYDALKFQEESGFQCRIL